MRLPWKSTPRAPSPTPSLSYKPATKQDKKADKQLASLHQHREKTGTLHPDVPLYPAGRRPMTGEEAAATRIFKDRYEALGLEAAEAGVTDVFRNREYGQTFRRDGGDMVANQQYLRVGERTSIAPEPGMYPPNTRMEIHSHPDIALLYYPPTDTFLSYTGTLAGPRGAPEFHELFDPFPPSRPTPSEASSLRAEPDHG